MLADLLNKEQLTSDLIPRDQWHPFPRAAERGQWEALPKQVRLDHIDRGEKALAEPWSNLTASLFLEYYRSGDYMAYQKASFDRRHRLRDLVTAECMEGRGRFVDEIANGIWLLCEESFWGLSPNTFVQASEEDQVKYSNQQLQQIRTVLPDVTRPGFDLWVGETAGVLSWSVYLLSEELKEVSPLLADRVYLETERRVLDPCMDRNFLWMGFLGQRVGNWNPWCNSNWLTSVLLLDIDENRRMEAVLKVLNSLDCFISQYKPDGGCDEGPSYWGRAAGSLFDCLELLHSATNGAIDIYDKPLIREMAAFIYRVHISDRYYVNFADAPGSIRLASDLVYRFGLRTGDTQLQALGKWAAGLGTPSLEGSLGRELPAIFNAKNLAGIKVSAPITQDVWLKDIQVMTARSAEGAGQDIFLAVKGGHNREHHNHNDVGNFLVYSNGKPVIIDVGAGTYTAKNSSPQRYDIWTMQSAYHNLPTFDSVMQGYGGEYAARVIEYAVDDQRASLTLDLSNAYPLETLRSWARSLTLNRGHSVQLTETFETDGSIQEVNLSLMTASDVEVSGNSITLNAKRLDDQRSTGAAQICFDDGQLSVSAERIDLDDPKIKTAWGDYLFRILFQAKAPVTKSSWSFTITPS